MTMFVPTETAEPERAIADRLMEIGDGRLLEAKQFIGPLRHGAILFRRACRSPVQPAQMQPVCKPDAMAQNRASPRTDAIPPEMVIDGVSAAR